MKEALKAKITSKDELLGVIGKANYSNAVYHIVSGLGEASIAQAQWWAVREYERLRQGLYETTDAIDILNKLSRHFVHISLGDRSMVAFTPDKAAGEADRQVITTFGRVASKLLPICTDSYIRDLTAEHLADLSSEIEFLVGPEIVEFYRTDTRTSACMSRKPWADKGFSHDPVEIYNTEGVRLAVLRDKDGVINARALVWEQGERKIYIRAYGDAKLAKRLSRQGYEKGNWTGMTFKKLIFKSEEASGQGVDLIMPYLDANDATGSSAHCSFIVYGDRVQVLTNDAKSRLSVLGLGHHISVATAASGLVRVRPLEVEQIQCVDERTQKPLNLLEDDPILLLQEGSEIPIKTELTEEEQQSPYLSTSGNHTPEGRTIVRYDSRHFSKFYDGEYWVDTTLNRRAKGFVKLSSDLYPSAEDQAEWFKPYQLAGLTYNNSQQYARKADCWRLLKADGTIELLFGVPERALRKLAPNGSGHVAYFDPKVVTTYRTSSGKPVHPSFNDNVTKCWDGGYEFSRSVKQIRVSDISMECCYVKRRMTDAESEAFSKWKAGYDEELLNRMWVEAGEDIYEFMSIATDRIAYMSRRVYLINPATGGQVTVFANYFTGHRGGQATKEASESWNEPYSELDFFKQFLKVYKGLSYGSSNVVGQFVDRKLAEMEALDYTNQRTAPAVHLQGNLNDTSTNADYAPQAQATRQAESDAPSQPGADSAQSASNLYRVDSDTGAIVNTSFGSSVGTSTSSGTSTSVGTSTSGTSSGTSGTSTSLSDFGNFILSTASTSISGSTIGISVPDTYGNSN